MDTALKKVQDPATEWQEDMADRRHDLPGLPSITMASIMLQQIGSPK
jgi:hypothetical protein